MANSEEHRQEYRLSIEEIVYIEVASAVDDNPTGIAISTSVDISANGLRVICNSEMTEGSIHPISINMDKPERRLHLVAEVKWCNQVDGEYLIGLELFESADTDIQTWKEIIAERCAL